MIVRCYGVSEYLLACCVHDCGTGVVLKSLSSASVPPPARPLSVSRTFRSSDSSGANVNRVEDGHEMCVCVCVEESACNRRALWRRASSYSYSYSYSYSSFSFIFVDMNVCEREKKKKNVHANMSRVFAVYRGRVVA